MTWFLNGIELGSSSMRIYQKDVQKKMFEALGMSEERIRERFGFMVDAFSFGTPPPRRGCLLGLDRLVMQMVGAASLPGCDGFPKLKDASCLLTGAPDSVDAEQMELLHISLVNGAAGAAGGATPKAQKNGADRCGACGKASPG